jgi:hypothetical protein
MQQVRSVTLGLVLAAIPGAAAAQTIPSPYRHIETTHAIGIFGGHLETDPGRYDLGPRPASLLGARYNIRFTGPLSGEVATSFGRTERTLYTRAAPGAASPRLPVGDTDVSLLLAEAGLRFQFTGARTWRSLAPFAVATGGLVADLTRTDAREEAIAEELRYRFGPAFAAGIALGSALFLTERLSLRGEVRDYVWRLAYPASLTDDMAREAEWRHNIALMLGGAFHF